MRKISSFSPYFFDEFFASGKEESTSPFLTPNSRKWAKNLPLKGAILSAFLLLIAFGFSFFHIGGSLLFLAGVYFLAGTPALVGSLKDLRNLEINIDVLMTFAALLSIVIGSAFEGALLLVLFALSGAMENAVSQKTKSALLNLRKLTPKMAWVLDKDGTARQQSISEISLGTPILIKAGEIIPLDGIVVDGSSTVNLAHLTGESTPQFKQTGDAVTSGALNLEGTLTLKVTHTSSDSTLSRIMRLILEAQEAKPKLERFFDRFGKWYASSIMLGAFAFALSFPFLFSMPFLGEEGSIYRALTFLIAASPCALIIAIPTAYLSCMSSYARKGILLKGGNILDALASCSVIAFDKTGTLTTGKLRCVSVESLTPNSPYSTEWVLSVAAGLEKHASHPISEAIVDLAKKKNIPPAEILKFQSKTGFGLEGITNQNGKEISAFVGNPAYIEEKMSSKLWETFPSLKKKVSELENTHCLLLIEENLFAFHFEDQLRPEAASCLAQLKKNKKYKIVMVTGDHSAHAHSVAKFLGIDQIYSNLRPEEKLNKIAELCKQEKLVMIGDGMNDAPALARATVGISMGKIGSTAAVDASDVIFLQDDLIQVDWALKKAKQAMRIVKQNFILALSVIILATTPALLGWVPLWIAVLLHEGGTVLVGLNSLRLLSSK